MKEYMEARILSVAQYTIDHNSTVRLCRTRALVVDVFLVLPGAVPKKYLV